MHDDDGLALELAAAEKQKVGDDDAVAAAVAHAAVARAWRGGGAAAGGDDDEVAKQVEAVAAVREGDSGEHTPMHAAVVVVAAAVSRADDAKHEPWAAVGAAAVFVAWEVGTGADDGLPLPRDSLDASWAKTRRAASVAVVLAHG